MNSFGPFAAGLLGLLALALAMAWHQLRLQNTNNVSDLDQVTHAFRLSQGIIAGLDGRIVAWSGGAERLYGYTSQQAIGRISHDLLRTVSSQPLSEIEATLLTDGFWQGELEHHRRDGVARHIACHWTLHRGAAGKADTVIIISNDITELKQAEAELRESEMRLRMALDASEQGVWLWEIARDTFEFQWDVRCKLLYGFEPTARVDYATWAAAIHVEDREMAEAALSRALDPADPYDDYACSFRAVRPDGRVVWLAAKGGALFAPDTNARSGRRMLRILGTIHDVSDAKQAERERQRASALLRTIMETAPGSIYAKDRRGRMLAANQAVMEAFGKSWTEMEGRTDLELAGDPRQGEAVMYHDRQIMEQRRTERVEELVSGEDGRTRVWLSTKAPMCAPDGQVIGLVGLSIEITDRKRDEDRLLLMVNELNHRVKNTLATVHAITLQTLQGIDTAIRGTLENRLLAVASAHDVLTREKWEGAELDAVIDGALAPFGGRDCGRFDVSGPPLLLCPKAAVALAMGLHELATNAAKYGALSVIAGQVDIHWELVPVEVSSLRLTWAERGGPRVSWPVQRGFGCRLLERNLAQGLGGSAQISFEAPEGVTYLMEIPLTELVSGAETAFFPRIGIG